MADRIDPRIDPEGKRLPIKLDSTSNGEFVPVPLSPANRAANRLAHEFASAFSKKLSFGRRKFLTSACGAASTLLAFNAANAAAGRSGGFFDLPKDAALDDQLARVQVGPAKDEFIFDVQGHFIDTPKGNAKSAEVFVKDVFMDSDTDVMVLSFVPSRRDAEPVTIQAADAMRRVVEKLEGTHRLLLHGRVNPNQPGDLEGMDELKEKWGVSAWKTYTQWGPNGRGFFLSDDVGIRFIERARKLGVKNIAVHKGLPFGQQSYEHSQCSDIGVVASRSASPTSTSSSTTPASSPACASRPTSPAATASIPWFRLYKRIPFPRARTSTPSSAAPGASSCAILSKQLML